MKKLFTLAALALVTISTNAQEKSWTFENWETADYAEDFTQDGLTVHAVDGSYVSVAESKKTAEIDGETVNYTKNLQLKGLASTSARHISFEVDGPCEITVAYFHGTSSGEYKRVLNLSYGDVYDAANLHSMVVPTGGAGAVSTVRYELDQPNTIYIGSGNSGVNILGIYVKTIVPDEPDPSTSTMAWDFTAELSADDVANLDADTETWSKTEDSYVRYTYNLSFNADSAVDNLYGVKLTANGQEIEKTQGLCFGRPNGKLDSGRFCLDDGKRLCVNGADVGFIIPDLKRNDVVKVRFATGKSGEARTLVLTNLTTTDECTSESNSVPQEVTCKVLSDGYVGFRGTNSLYYYSVTVNEGDTSSGIPGIEVADKATDGKIYNLCGMEVGVPSTGIYIRNGKKFVANK